MFRLYRTNSGIHLEHDGAQRDVQLSINDLFRASDPVAFLEQAWEKGTPLGDKPPILLAPIESQQQLRKGDLNKCVLRIWNAAIVFTLEIS